MSAEEIPVRDVGVLRLGAMSHTQLREVAKVGGSCIVAGAGQGEFPVAREQCAALERLRKEGKLSDPFLVGQPDLSDAVVVHAKPRPNRAADFTPDYVIGSDGTVVDQGWDSV